MQTRNPNPFGLWRTSKKFPFQMENHSGGSSAPQSRQGILNFPPIFPPRSTNTFFSQVTWTITQSS
ncbi:hypothetical protein I7I53_01578 [Histoplasma capsulatum var. duboisii H88]|uniref:Uncharacterized protein n=1 Tax=Ajellomyces capsulatus (strain H88) TaxID=544711 RepID=A0A8A1LM29_AJEC8|nr:hypothetical protein I7I53_01578 [Histoplasma capsulatum var. duboisii H88]